jgi:hypothetical protein
MSCKWWHKLFKPKLLFTRFYDNGFHSGVKTFWKCKFCNKEWFVDDRDNSPAQSEGESEL